MSDVIRDFNVQVSGNGEQAIIFVHGLGCNQEIWRFVTSAFKDEYKVILLDLMGSGLADISNYEHDRYTSLQGHAKDLLAVLEALKLKEVVCVAHSVGCMISMLAAISRPELFQRMIMIAPSPCYINKGNYIGGFTQWEVKDLIAKMKDGIKAWADQYVPLIINTEGATGEIEEMSQNFCSGDPDILQQFTEVTFLSDHREDLVKLTVPSLILQCTEDIIAPLSVGTYMHKQMPASNLTILKATGHCPHLTAPEELSKTIKAYLDVASGMHGQHVAAGKQIT